MMGFIYQIVPASEMSALEFITALSNREKLSHSFNDIPCNFPVTFGV